MKDTRSVVLRHRLVDLSVAIARSGPSCEHTADLEEQLDQTIGELEAHEGREICLQKELDAAHPSQVLAMIEPIRDRIEAQLSTVSNASDQAILRCALSGIDAKIARTVRALLADRRNAS